MAEVRFRPRHQVVACELDAAQVGGRLDDWRRLRADFGLGAEAAPGGAVLWLREEAWDAASRLAGMESECCGFLDFRLSRDGQRVRLEVTAPSPEGRAVVAELLGISAGD